MMHAALSVWILSAVVSLGRGDHHGAHDLSHANDHQHHHPELDNRGNSLSLVSLANKDFAYRLYKQLAAQPDSLGKNIFFSPASVTLALAVLAVGARGETHQQLFKGLGFNSTLLTQVEVDQAFHTLLTRHNRTSEEDISEGTAVFVHNTFSPRPEFLEVLRQSYLAEGFTVDFTKATESADTINKYVADKTNGKIDKLVESLDPSTIMYLISYLYYKGKWEIPFDPADTTPEMFHVDEQTEVPVQMMNAEMMFSTYYDREVSTSILRLPFNNSNSMLLLLPDSGLAGLEEVICQNHVTKWLKWMKPRKYNVFVPKFSIKTTFSLKDVLHRMGMSDMFGTEADLSGISERQNLVVSEVVHQASLDVDEAGATAAAATGVGIMPMSFQRVPVLRFDRPFMVIIIESNTESILFMGKIINPNI